MMSKMKLKQSINLLTFACLAALSTHTYAEQTRGYYGIGYHMGSYENTGIPDADIGAIAFRAGGYLNQVIALEARLALGISDDTVRTSAINSIDIELDTALSAFIKADVPMTPFVNAYGLLGLTRGEIETSSASLTSSESETGLSYGLGIEGEINRRTSLSIEYVQLLDEDAFEYTAINVGITTRF
jgi:opacity protein-like surface antigen